MTFDYKTMPVVFKEIEALKEVAKFLRTKKQFVSRFFEKDRRKNKKDRREGVRQGIIVTLSTDVNRRMGTDRRRV